MAIKSRQLHHQKAFRILVGKGIPERGEGSEGDIQLRITKDGLKLFAKYGNSWYQLAQAASTVSGADGSAPQSTTATAGNTIIDKGHIYMGGNIVMGGKPSLSQPGWRTNTQYDSKSSVDRVRFINNKGGRNRGLTFLTDETALFRNSCVGFTPVTGDHNTGAASTVDFRYGNIASLTLTGNPTQFEFTLPDMNGIFTCAIIQDGTGGRQPTSSGHAAWKFFDSTGTLITNGGGTAGRARWKAGLLPTLSSGADKIDLLKITYLRTALPTAKIVLAELVVNHS